MDATKLGFYFEDLEACPCKEVFEKVKHPWEALKQKDKLVKFKKKLEGEIEDGAIIKGDVTIGKGTKVSATATIEGPCTIGKNCTIRPGASIRPKSIIGDDVVIGHGAEIKNSIIFNECKISTNAFVGDSILGKGARTASGVITGNRRFDQKKVTIRVNDEEFPTGMEKFGCIIGEYTRIGANTSTSPGTLIGKHVWIYANTMIRGIIEPNKLVKLRQEIEIVDKEPVKLETRDSEGKI